MTIVVVSIDWLLRLKTAREQGKWVPSHEGTGKWVLLARRLSAAVPAAIAAKIFLLRVYTDIPT